jgi:hypothetical protein
MDLRNIGHAEGAATQTSIRLQFVANDLIKDCMVDFQPIVLQEESYQCKTKIPLAMHTTRHRQIWARSTTGNRFGATNRVRKQENGVDMVPHAGRYIMQLDIRK